MRRLLLAPLALSLALTFVFSARAADPMETFGVARVTQILSETEDHFEDLSRLVQSVAIQVEGGPMAGEKAVIENGVLPGREDMKLSVGDRIVVQKLERADGTEQFQWRERYRLPNLVALCFAFLVLVMFVGRKTGLSSLVGLVLSILVLVYWMVPMIAKGYDPLLISLLASTVIACTSLLLAHGFNRRSYVALLSTLVTLACSVIMALIAVHIAKLFGMGSEESLYLQTGAMQNVNLRGLLLGGIVIGCLGVLDDITTAQTAVVDEIRKANPSISKLKLHLAAASVGREHIASLINTLALAYAGAALPLLLLFQGAEGYPLWLTLNSESISEELVRTLVGSATLLLAVPISTALAIVLLKENSSGPKHWHAHAH